MAPTRSKRNLATMSLRDTIRGMSAEQILSMRRHRNAAAAPGAEIVPASRPTLLPLSFAQQRLWFLGQIEGVSEAYHVPAGLRLRGPLDEAVLRRALDRLVARHEALRTSFGATDGEPFQRIASADAGFTLVRHDLGGIVEAEAVLGRLILEEAAAPFDLEHGPLIRGRLIRLAPDDHVLLITSHHIVSDGWSMSVLANELSALYGAFCENRPDPLPPLPVQYADYVLWQRNWLSGQVLADQSAYWRGKLSGAPAVLELPTDRPRPSQQDLSGGYVKLEFDPDLTSALKALARRHGATLFMTVLAGWALLLSRLSGQRDLVIGTPVANRTRSEIEGLIGFFVNTLALRIDLSGSPSVDVLIERAKEVVLGAQEHQDLPFEQVVEQVQPSRSAAHPPLFQAMFAWQSDDGQSFDLPGLAVEEIKVLPETSKFDITLSLVETRGRIEGDLEFATALFDRATIERFARYLRNILAGMAQDPGQPAAAILMLPEEERQRLVAEWNSTALNYPADYCIHHLFQEQAARCPRAIAVRHEEEALSYGALNARANQIAHHLRTLGVGRDMPVGLCLDRSVEMVVGLLAILKAGGAYLPLDPAYPPERLGFMIGDCEPKIILTHGPARPALEKALNGLQTFPTILDVEEIDASGVPDGDLLNSAVGLSERNLAYIIYTSGSTGRPKGVMVEHRSLASLAAGYGHLHSLEPKLTHLQMASFSFDIFTGDVIRSLCHGGNLVICPKEDLLDADRLLDLIDRQEVAIAEFVPVVLRNLAEHLRRTGRTMKTMKTVICGADVWMPADNRALQVVLDGGTMTLNTYGVTEASIDSASLDLSNYGLGELTAIPLGKPVANVQLYVLDALLEPVPVGVAGQLFIGGTGLARGYHDRPGLTADRFIASPFSPGERLYRTGDLGRYLPDGNIEFLGRSDFQVKIRGFRVELGEIEAKLAAHPSVREAVVLAREERPGEKRLVAYYTPAEGTTISPAQLRTHLLSQLPQHMVPAAYIRLGALPLTPNGKLDRKALPSPTAEAVAAQAYEPPATPTERAIADIWAELLGLGQIGRQDNFFDLGGHSMMAVKMVDRMRRGGVGASMQMLLEHPVLERLAASASALPVLPTVASNTPSPLVTLREGRAPPLILIHALGGGLKPYLGLVEELQGDQQIVGVHAFAEGWSKGPGSVSNIAENYAEAIFDRFATGPYTLAGWSFGGLLAHRIAQLLQEGGGEVEQLILIDAYTPEPDRFHNPDERDIWPLFLEFLRTENMLPGDMPATVGGGLPDEDLEALLRAMTGAVSGGQPLGLQDLRAMRDVFDRHARSINGYRPTPFEGDAIHFVATGGSDRETQDRWRVLVGGSLTTLLVAADHHSILRAPHVRQIAAALRRDGAQGQLPGDGVGSGAADECEQAACADAGCLPSREAAR